MDHRDSLFSLRASITFLYKCSAHRGSTIYRHTSLAGINLLDAACFHPGQLVMCSWASTTWVEFLCIITPVLCFIFFSHVVLPLSFSFFFLFYLQFLLSLPKSMKPESMRSRAAAGAKGIRPWERAVSHVGLVKGGKKTQAFSYERLHTDLKPSKLWHWNTAWIIHHLLRHSLINIAHNSGGELCFYIKHQSQLQHTFSSKFTHSLDWLNMADFKIMFVSRTESCDNPLTQRRAIILTQGPHWLFVVVKGLSLSWFKSTVI